MYYAKSTGGFYDAAIHGGNIPADAVEIATTEHAALLAGQSNGKRIVADAAGRPVLADPPAPTFDELRTAKLAEINAACEVAIGAIKASYPASEVLSWSKQEAEARAFVADAAAATPLLDALATARGIAKADLAAWVIAKADLFAQISGGIIGKRQKLEDQLEVATTTEEVAAIMW